MKNAGSPRPEIRDTGHGTSSNPGLTSIRPGSNGGSGSSQKPSK